MRVKNSIINSIVNISSYLLILIPNFVVRKVFLQTLGDEWLGINSLYTNIIGFLSIIELGIGSAIIFSLYKPFADNDRAKIKGYLNFYRKFYKIIGTLILIIGLFFIPFLKFFIKGQVSIINANINFILFLINTYITYLFSYKLCLLNVAQEEYKISIATTLSKIIISLLQIWILNIYPSFELYLIIQIFIQILYYLILNIYIDKKYIWINNTIGNISVKEKKSLIQNMRALFMHKIGSFIVLGTDNLLITFFIDLATVAKFNSYNMIILAGKNIITKGLSGVTASIGNLLVKNKSKAYFIHEKLFFLNFWIVSLFTIIMFNTLNQFITLWLGENQLLDNLTIILLLINFYFSCMRGSVERFQEGSGVYYYDRYASIIEAIINLISSIIFVNLIGLPGVFLGTLASNFLVIFWTKPFIIYKYVFKEKVINYYKIYFKYLFIAIIPFTICTILSSSIKSNIKWNSFILNVILNFIIINLVYLIIFFKNDNFIYFKDLTINFIKNHNKRYI
ncbi:O-unit flippase [Clostridium perfringens]|nr:O-unit flippase [Clostridium perfringens]MDM0922924.1 O-unit flippase [Clostridium perfringens]